MIAWRCRFGPNTLRWPGFTLLEMLVVLAVLAILLGLALPGYQQYTQRAHRADAVRSLLAVAQCQERLRAAEGAYRPGHCLQAADTPGYAFRTEPDGEPTAWSFTAIATPIAGEDADACGALTLDHTGRRGISQEGASVFDCWGGR